MKIQTLLSMLLAFTPVLGQAAPASSGCMLPMKAQVGTIAVRLGVADPTTVTFLFPELVKSGREFRVTVALDTSSPAQKAMLDFAIAARHANRTLIVGIYYPGCPSDLLETFPLGKTRVDGTRLLTMIEWGRDDFNHMNEKY